MPEKLEGSKLPHVVARVVGYPDIGGGDHLGLGSQGQMSGNEVIGSGAQVRPDRRVYVALFDPSLGS